MVVGMGCAKLTDASCSGKKGRIAGATLPRPGRSERARGLAGSAKVETAGERLAERAWALGRERIASGGLRAGGDGRREAWPGR